MWGGGSSATKHRGKSANVVVWGAHLAQSRRRGGRLGRRACRGPLSQQSVADSPRRTPSSSWCARQPGRYWRLKTTKHRRRHRRRCVHPPSTSSLVVETLSKVADECSARESPGFLGGGSGSGPAVQYCRPRWRKKALIEVSVSFLASTAPLTVLWKRNSRNRPPQNPSLTLHAESNSIRGPRHRYGQEIASSLVAVRP